MLQTQETCVCVPEKHDEGISSEWMEDQTQDSQQGGLSSTLTYFNIHMHSSLHSVLYIHHIIVSITVDGSSANSTGASHSFLLCGAQAVVVDVFN